MADEKKKGFSAKGMAEFFDKLSKLEKTLVYIAGFFILIVLLDRIILGPIMNRIKSLDDEIAQQISIIKDGLMIIGYDDIINEEYKTMAAFFTDERKSQEEEMADFLKDVENHSVRAGVHLITITPSENVEDAKAYTKYELELEGKGTVEQIAKFIYELTNAASPTKVETIELIPGKLGAELTTKMKISRIFVMA